MTVSELRAYTVKDLSALARKHGVEGYHAMRKDDLVRAVSAVFRKAARAKAERGAAANGKSKANRHSSNGHGANGRTSAEHSNGHASAHQNGSSGKSNKAAKSPVKPAPVPVMTAAARQQLDSDRARRTQAKDLAFAHKRSGKKIHKDRLVVMVRDPYWLHAYWELTHRGVERARAALAQEWHAARPVLRLVEVGAQQEVTATERTLRYIEVHGGVCNWYIDVENPPHGYRIEIGYLTTTGRFYSLARSNTVSTPTPGSSDHLDENWTEVAENFDRIYALSANQSQEGPAQELQELFEERLRRPMSAPVMPQLGIRMPNAHEFHFEVDAELIVYGKSEPDARITLKGEPVELRPDGTFTVRYNLPNCRQVIPVTAQSADGLETRTTVLALERNTKTMEPVIHDSVSH